MLVKGNVVKLNGYEQHAMVLAVRKDGTAAKLYIYGPDSESWLPVKRFTVKTEGTEQCYKCAGSGLYYFGGMVLNGVYTGKTGVCYGCEGKGTQNDADRLRCHHYWHRKVEAGDDIESPLEPAPQQPLPDSPKAKPPTGKRSHSGGAIPAVPERVSEKHDSLVDCRDCGCLHRDDVACPW